MPKNINLKSSAGDIVINPDSGSAVLQESGVTKLETTATGVSVTGDIYFQNVFATLGDLPPASDQHGMFAHVHATGKGYFAHAGSWIALANEADVPATLTDLGITDGSAGQQLTTDGSGNFTFAAAGSGGGGGSSLQSRTTKAQTTTAIADGLTTDIDIVGFKAYSLMAIQTSAAAWIRIYATNSARVADNSRIETSDPAPDAGVIAEVITSGAETVLISPGALGYNMETTPTTNIPVKVTNKSGSAAAITVTLTVLQLEA